MLTTTQPLDPLESPEESDGDESDKDSTASSDSDPKKDKDKPREDRRTVESWAQGFACIQKFDPKTRRFDDVCDKFLWFL